VIHAAPDGYTILILSIANAVHPSMYKLNYDLLKGIEPVSMVVTSPNTLAVNPDFPAKTVKEFIALAKAKPGDIPYASAASAARCISAWRTSRRSPRSTCCTCPSRAPAPAPST
jgi:tripartite-type tricarboxylate transporter receptor subunit TctC